VDPEVRFPVPDLRECAILLDIDGTIVDIAPTPDEVRVPNSLRRVLARLSERTNGAVALVSGRSLEDIDLLFAPLRLTAVGGHGAQLRIDGEVSEARDVPELELELRRRLAAIARDGVVAEDKGFSVALHYRLVPDKESVVRDAVARVCAEPWSAPIEILPGKAVLEIKRAGFSKATAVRALMAHPSFAGRCPIFIGDDTTDESVFAIMPELGGLAFAVGSRISSVPVDGCFDTPASVRAWLERIAPAGESVSS
jgi:trehalose 6-phosphate phosphatase